MAWSGSLSSTAKRLVRRLFAKSKSLTPRLASAARTGRGDTDRALSLQELMAGGAGFDQALAVWVRQLLADGKPAEALATGYSLAAQADTRELGTLVLGMCHHTLSCAPTAWRDFSRITDPELVALVPWEWFETAFKSEPEAGRLMVHRLADAGLLARIDNEVALLKVARRAFGCGFEHEARIITDHCLARGTIPDASAVRRWFDQTTAWYSGGPMRKAQHALQADVRVGVINYKQPDNSSRNVGDWIQTLASLGHLVRHRNLAFVGEDPDLVGFVKELSGSVKPEREVRDSPAATVQLVEVQRDASNWQELPDQTWMLAFGWFMHDYFELGYDFPFNPAIRPLFVSVHLNRTDMLTPEVVDYLRQYAPIGCRDWHSVIALLDVGVPAFFSGCITTTVDTVFPEQGGDERTSVGYVDYLGRRPRAGEPVREQSIRSIRSRPLTDNLRLARSWVEEYARKYRKLYTSRLHCYLPATSVGCEVVFEPENPSDIRFGGLIGLDEPGFDAMRDGLLGKIGSAMAKVLAGADADEVYAHWREICATDVAAAAEFVASLDFSSGARPPALPPIHEGRKHVAMVLVERGQARHVPAVLNQLSEHGPADLGVVLVGQATRELDAAKLSSATGLPVVAVNSGSWSGFDSKGAKVRDLLIVGALSALRGAGRVLVVPTATLVRESLDELFDMDLQGQPVAAIDDPRRGRQSTAELIRHLGSQQEGDWRRAAGFLAGATRGKGIGSTLFEATVMLVDPARLAELDFDRLAGAIITGHQVSFRDTVNLVIGRHRATLPDRFHVLPHLSSPTPDTAILAYRVVEPWGELFVPFAEEWRRHAKLAAAAWG